MGSSQQAFNQVKAILGKLDRSIDEARERRLGDQNQAEEPAKAEPEVSAVEDEGDNGRASRLPRARAIPLPSPGREPC